MNGPRLTMCALLLSAASTATPAFAQAPTPPASTKERAKATYLEGAKAFKAKDYATALQLFERAYKLDPSPVLIYNLARVHEEMGNAAESIDHFELYLSRVPDSPDKGDIERRVRVMKAILDRSKAPPQTPVAEASTEPEAPSDPIALKPFAYGSLGVGGALLIAGVVYGLKANSAEEDHNAATNGVDKGKFADDANQFSTLANVGLIGGGVLLAAGATLWFLDGGEEGALTLAPTPGGAAMGWSIHF